MPVEAVALPYRLVVTADPDSREIVELPGLVVLRGGDVIEVLHSKQESASSRSRQEHRAERRSQVADMEITGR
jgi:hypothetical protein